MQGLIDSTLREGEQMAGVYFSLMNKMEMLLGLHALGVEEIEMGVVSEDDDLKDIFNFARQHIHGPRLSVWSRCTPGDIVRAGMLKPDGISIALPVSDLHLEKRLNRDRAWLIDRIPHAVYEARDAGIDYVSLGLEDATRADDIFLNTVVRSAVDAGADRVRFADTLGQTTPDDLGKMVRKFTERFRIEIGVHTHNDFGMATAAALAALDAGADWADATLLGLGERAGNARLEEMCGFLMMHRGQYQYDLRVLSGLAQTAASAAGIKILPYHPLIGEAIFTCETGIHLHGLERDTATYEPYPPELVSAERHLLIGKKTGRCALRRAMAEMSIYLTDIQLEGLVRSVKTFSRSVGRPLSLNEVRSLALKRSNTAEQNIG